MDTDIAVWVATHRVAALDGLFIALGSVGRIGAIWGLLALVIALARRCTVRRTALFVGFTMLTTFVADSISFGVKDLFMRTRPFIAHPEIHPLYEVHSSSFPAGHAATAFAGAVVLSVALPRGTPVFLLLAVVIAFSRVYVGVHYPTDVVAGAAIGACVGTAAAIAFRLVGARDPNWRGLRSVATAAPR